MFLCNLRRTYVFITLLYSYVKTPYLTQQAFNCSKSTIETLEKGLTCSKLAMKLSERHHGGRSAVFIINLELFQIFPEFFYCWLLTDKCLLRKLSDIGFVWYLFQLVYWRKAGLNKKQCRKFCYFSYFIDSVRCNLCKPSITQIIHSRNTGQSV